MIGGNIRAERMRRRWRQRDLAERLGWSRSTVSRIERERRRISREELAALGVALGIGTARLAEDASPGELAALGGPVVRVRGG